jgi:hypothetical protein
MLILLFCLITLIKSLEHIFTKLRSQSVNSKNNMTETIQDRIKAGNKAYYANQMMLKNRCIKRGAKMQIYKTLIRPVVTYGCEKSV